MTNKIETKKTLIDLCKKKLVEQMAVLKKAMDEAQEEANAHKGAMESRYDTFKEEAQSKKDAYSRQLMEKVKVMSFIASINPFRILNKAEIGAIVVTEKNSFFISYHIFNDPIVIHNVAYILINAGSPLGKSFQDKKKGDVVTTLQGEIRILDIY